MDFLRRHGVRTIAIYLLAFICVTLTLIIINPAQGGWTNARLGLAVAIVALVFTPIAFLAHRWRALLEHTEAYHLKESIMSEEELRDAVRLWVYIRQGQVTQGDAEFTINEAEELSCRYYVAQE